VFFYQTSAKEEVKSCAGTEEGIRQREKEEGEGVRKVPVGAMEGERKNPVHLLLQKQGMAQNANRPEYKHLDERAGSRKITSASWENRKNC